MVKKNIPFDFIFDYLTSVDISIKPMFGMYALYSGEKIIFVLRHRNDHEEANGVWIATSREYHKSLKAILPGLCSISILSNQKNDTEWQMLPADSSDFETSVIKACEIFIKGDPAIGRIPKPKKKKSKST